MENPGSNHSCSTPPTHNTAAGVISPRRCIFEGFHLQQHVHGNINTTRPRQDEENNSCKLSAGGPRRAFATLQPAGAPVALHGLLPSSSSSSSNGKGVSGYCKPHAGQTAAPAPSMVYGRQDAPPSTGKGPVSLTTAACSTHWWWSVPRRHHALTPTVELAPSTLTAAAS